MLKNEKMKVLVIGLDGATFDNLKPRIREGKLPNFANIMGMPIPKGLDGKVLTDAFEESFLVKRTIKYEEVEYERERVRGRIRRLKALGKI